MRDGQRVWRSFDYQRIHLWKPFSNESLQERFSVRPLMTSLISGETACPLPEFLGLSDDEYGLWVERPTTLELIIQAHTAGMRLEKVDANVA